MALFNYPLAVGDISPVSFMVTNISESTSVGSQWGRNLLWRLRKRRSWKPKSSVNIRLHMPEWYNQWLYAESVQTKIILKAKGEWWFALNIEEHLKNRGDIDKLLWFVHTCKDCGEKFLSKLVYNTHTQTHLQTRLARPYVSQT
jgi:hypothetical protein